jgi:hypothetical protein
MEGGGPFFPTPCRIMNVESGMKKFLGVCVVLGIGLGAGWVHAGERFDKALELQGVTFAVSCANDSSLNEVTIVPAGLEEDNEVAKVEADGVVTGAEVADLNADGSPEVYVYVQSAGSGGYGSVIGYGANRKKSMSPIYLEELAEGSEHLAGYMGHDEYAVVESTLVRRFPIYKEGDSNAEPTGGMRQIQYKLKAGEAGWLLKVDKVVAY